MGSEADSVVLEASSRSKSSLTRRKGERRYASKWKKSHSADRQGRSETMAS